jgi:hypothetical protein
MHADQGGARTQLRPESEQPQAETRAQRVAREVDGPERQRVEDRAEARDFLVEARHPRSDHCRRDADGLAKAPDDVTPTLG